MRTKLIVAGIFIGILGISAGFFLYQKPAEKAVSGKAAYSLHAVQLFREFSNDEPAANAKYLNRVVSVEGRIAEVNAVDSVGLTVILESENPLFGVSCQLPEGVTDRRLRQGESIRIKGLCTGKLMDVVLVKCVVEK